MTNKKTTKINFEIDAEIYLAFKEKYKCRELTLHGIRAYNSKLLEQCMLQEIAQQ